MRILVTGSNGFVGSSLVARLITEGVDTVAAVRSEAALPGAVARVGEIDGNTRWEPALGGVDAVVHLAARVHVMRETAKNPLAEFRRVNLDGTVNLARQAAAAGVRRFVYVSTVKVLGEESGESPLTDTSPCVPVEPYAVSKLEAEKELFEIGTETGMEIVVLRPPLVYGPGVGGNFLRLLRLARIGVPLPFGMVANRRSMIYLENLVDALYLCLSAPLAANRAYLVCDGVALSTGELLRRLMRYMGKKPLLLPVPPGLLKGAASVLGLGREISRLTGSLEVDDSRIRAELNWQPPVSVEDGLQSTVAWFLKDLNP